MELAIKNTLCFFVRAQSAETGPPLGTVLGNLGLNTSKFVNEFNDFTRELPSYFLLKVYIYVLEDRSFTFAVSLPSTGFILMFIKLPKDIIKFSKKIIQFYIPLKDIVQLAMLKFPGIPLKITVPLILGTAFSCNLLVC